jgi:hypothetical protein
MAQDLEKLVVSLEANLRQFERELARAQKITVSQMRAIERQAQKSGTQIEQSFGAMGKKVGAGLAGLFTIATLNKLKDMVQGVADLAEQAQVAGVSIEDLQRLKFVGVTVGINTEQLTTSLAKFNRLLGESQEKGKGLVDIFKENGVEITSNTQAFLALADIIKNASSETERAVIANKALGKGGAALVPLFMMGTDALKEMMAQADKTGAVINGELVRAADAFYDRWAQKIDAWYTFFSGQIAGLAVSLDTLFSDVNTAGIDQLGLKIKELQDRINNPIRSDVENFFTDTLKSFGGKTLFEGIGNSAAELQAELEPLLTQYRELLKLQDQQNKHRTTGAGGGDDGPDEIQKVIDALEFERQQLQRNALQQAINTELRKADVSATSEQGQRIVKLVTANFNLEASQKAATKAKEEAARKDKDALSVLKGLTDRMEDERQQLGLTKDEYEIYNNIKAAGVDISSEAAAKIRDETAAIQAQRAAMKETTDKADDMAAEMKKIQDAFKGAFGDLAVAASDGKLKVGELIDILGSLRDQLIRMAAEKLFILALSYATNSPAPAAMGGHVNAGDTRTVGERGQELFVPAGGSIPAAAKQALRMLDNEAPATASEAGPGEPYLIGTTGTEPFVARESGTIVPAERTASVLEAAIKPIEARAKGGPVQSGEPYVVGEKGSEIFVPHEAGVIVPADKTKEVLERIKENYGFDLHLPKRAAGGPVASGRSYEVGERGRELFVPTRRLHDLPARASGGSVQAGKAYMVGEKGPEPFIPRQSGTIIPAGKNKPPIINVINGPGIAATQSTSQSGGIDVVDIVTRVVESRFPDMLNRNAGLIGAKPASRRTV